MNELQIFNNEEFGQIRTLVKDNEVWFVGKDVAEALRYSATSAMKKIIDDLDCIEINPQSVDNIGLFQNGTILEVNKNIKRMLLINESGLYQAIFSSTLPKAKEFKRWVTREILPYIRKNGLYMTASKAQELITNPTEFLAKAVIVAQEQLAKISAENKIMKPKAEYFDALVERETLTNFRDTAKELGIKQKRFINWLLDNGYVYRDNNDQLKPYAGYEQYFKIKDTKSDKNQWSGTQTLITPQGKSMFRLLLEKENWI